jgi:hypothetical protein
MEEHTLKLLEFDKVRDLVDRYAPSDLGREASHGHGRPRVAAEPMTPASVSRRTMRAGRT